MIMKSIFNKILLGIFTITAFTACSDSFLNETPKGVWYKQIYDDKGTNKSLLILSKLFEGYDHYRDFSFCFPVVSMQSISTGDGVAPNGSDGGTDFVQCWNMTFTAENAQIRSYYQALYSIITSANQALQMISEYKTSNSEYDETTMNEYTAEAYFLRASAYWRLTQAYGNVPYADTVYAKTDSVPAQLDSHEIRSRYIKQLQWAINYLPSRVENNSTGNQGRATQNAARAILARTYMYEKDWANTLKWAADIINSGDNDLSTPYNEIWHEDKEYGPESVWEVNCAFEPNNKISMGSQYFMVQGFRGFPNLGWGHNGPSAKLISAFEKDDPRLNVILIKSGDVLDGDVSTGVDGFYQKFNGKCYCPKRERQLYGRDDWCYGYWSNIRLIRYSDILLMYAEAANELGQTQESLAKLEMVRSRARGNNLLLLPRVTITDKDNLREAIRHERHVELALEGERIFDLIRWGVAKEYMGDKFQVGKHELFPIPQSEIDKSNNRIKQNPGY
jgi:hypothetical protein